MKAKKSGEQRKKMTQEQRTDYERRKANMEALKGEIARRAEEAGLTLRTSIMQTGHTEVPHWHFHIGDETVFHWWPTNGKWWCPLNGFKGVEGKAWALLALAVCMTSARTDALANDGFLPEGADAHLRSIERTER